MTSYKKKVFLATILLTLFICMWNLVTNVMKQSKGQMKIKFTYGALKIPCIGSRRGQAEDLFCMEKPKYLPNYKNPCWFTKDFEGRDKKLHCLPYYHILGVVKGGTEDLFERLLAHPDVRNHSFHKESQYWNRNRYGYGRNGGIANLSWYVDVFSKAAEAIEKHVTGDNFHPLITGDAAVPDLTLFWGWPLIPQNAGLKEPTVLTPHLMKHLYRENPKFIILFRNPTDRLYSCFFYCGGKTAEEFHTAVVKSLAIHDNCMTNNTIKQCLYSREMKGKLPLTLYHGCYSVFMTEWLQVFPRKTFLILKTEEYHHDVKGTIQKVYDFLDLKYNETLLTTAVRLPAQHVQQSKRRAGPMYEKTRVLLDAFYREFKIGLADHLQDERFMWST